MARQVSSMLRRALRTMGAWFLGGCLLVGSSQAQSDGEARLEFRDGSEESEPRKLPDVVFSPLTPREPPAVPGSSAVSSVMHDPNVIPASGTLPDSLFSSPPPVESQPAVDSNLMQAGCSSCGSRLSGVGSLGGCSSCGAGGRGDSVCGSGPRPGCVPGREPFCGWHNPADGKIHRFIGGLYECLCCPDPCYDPVWIPLADTAFHVASVRPVTHSRIRWNSGQNVIFPDRAEFFWARQDGQGKGPRPANGALVAAERLRYDDLIYYFEAAAAGLGIIVETPYRSVDPVGAPHASGFGDIKVGTKTLLFDCELLQIGMQFLTYIPAGNAMKGLGTGHVSLEPSLLCGLKLGPDTYYQGQLSQWIPLGGDPDYAGGVLHTHHALNQVLYRCPGADIMLIGTTELHTWSFQDGAYTDPVFGSFQQASDETYVMAGPGFRVFICDKVDIGFSASFTLSRNHFAEQLYTTEFRFRY